MKHSQSNTSLATTRNVHRLVASLSKNRISADPAELLKAAKNASNALTFHSFRSNDEVAVMAQYNGLIEKWDMFGKSEKANALKMLLDEALLASRRTNDDSLNQFAIYQALSFLLFMSKSASEEDDPPPASTTSDGSSSTRIASSASNSKKLGHFNSLKMKAAHTAAIVDSSLQVLSEIHQRRTNPQLENEKLWRNILETDPLEGDHWNSVDYTKSDNGDSDYDDTDTMDNYIEDDMRTNQDETDALPDELPATFDTGLITPPNETYPESADLVKLLQSHYWNSANNGPQFGECSFDIDVPATLAPSIASHQSNDPAFFGVPVATTKYISELDVIREVLFVLHGIPAEMFELDNDSLSFKPKMIACLTHLTVEMLQSVMTQFAKWGTIVRKLQSFVKRIQDDTKTERLWIPSLGAVSYVLCETLEAHRTWIIEMQDFYFDSSRVLKDGEEPIAASVLQLMDRVAERFVPLNELYLIIRESGKIENNPFSPLVFINTFYSRLTMYQNSCDAFRYKWGITVLMSVLQPWFDAVEVWWLDGTLSTGVGFLCDEAVDIKSSDFWTSRFNADLKEVPTILWSSFNTTISIGKCMIMLRELNPELLVDVIPTMRKGFFASMMSEMLDVLQVDQTLPSPPPPPQSSISNISAASTASALFLFDRVWQPGETVSPLVVAATAGDAASEVSRTSAKSFWLDQVMAHNFDHQQLWRPFQEIFERVITSILYPKLQTVGATLIRQFLGDECRLLSHLRTLQQVFLMTCGLVMEPLVDTVGEKIRSGELWRRPGVLQEAFNSCIASFETAEEGSERWVEQSDRIMLIVDETKVTADMRKRGGGGRIHVSSVNCVQIGYDVSWPLNCIITMGSLEFYNKVFVFLMQLSLARNRLDKETLSTDKTCFGAQFGWMRQRTVLRRKMKVFCEGLTSFAMNTVIQPATTDFMKAVANFHDIDQLKKFHEAFLVDICDHFFLLNEKASSVLKSIYKCLDLCIKFSDMCMRFDSNVAFILAGKETTPTPSQSPTTTPTKTPPPQTSFGGSSRLQSSSRSGTTSPQPKNPSAAGETRKFSSRPASPSLSQIKKAGFREVQGGRTSVSSAKEPGEEQSSAQKRIQEEGVKFGVAVSGAHASFVELELFVVRSCTSMASHGMPKLAGLAAFLNC
ncbi:Spc98 family-domain-containing protein [Obelidium mucronatum]|nr:Spc98 family-domain-containing protein [Obelidium mucronatum]